MLCSAHQLFRQYHVADWKITLPGKDGCLYHRRYAVCLETQYLPNSPNLPHFHPIPVFPAGTPYHYVTQFRFHTDA